VGVAPLRVPQPGDLAFATSVLQRIGITAPTDVELVPVRRHEMLTNLGKDVDAIFTYSPSSFSVLDSGQGHIIFDSSTDAPWSQHLCCALFARRQFAKDPVATSRAVRAILRALEHGESDPAAMAQAMVAKSWVVTEEYATRTLAELTFGAWRTHDPEDSLRFYALYLHEAGLIQSTPEEIIAKGTDWTFFNELKQELAFAPRGDERNLSFYCDPATGSTVSRTPGMSAQRRTT
jgi:NitT/TauT family transport system substrate-binding protein